MIRNPFKDKHLHHQFDGGVRMFEVRHSTLFASDGQPHRLNGYASPFWQGYFDDKPHTIPKGTLAWAMYRAGQACRQEFAVAFKHDGKIGVARQHFTEQS